MLVNCKLFYFFSRVSHFFFFWVCSIPLEVHNLHLGGLSYEFYLYAHVQSIRRRCICGKKMFIKVLIVELAHQLSESIQCWRSIQGYGDWPAGLLNLQFSRERIDPRHVGIDPRSTAGPLTRNTSFLFPCFERAKEQLVFLVESRERFSPGNFIGRD